MGLRKRKMMEAENAEEDQEKRWEEEEKKVRKDAHNIDWQQVCRTLNIINGAMFVEPVVMRLDMAFRKPGRPLEWIPNTESWN
ncbi:hypothetical protein PoB_001712900 [Plakobranchus ocellatus]|uniref:Uncharacterized protein n=1 Tax=Plakobranchus ocellatus TaxID=259542 RepID=A0AAV3Z9K1_9GAST|nr:hypothetical protein PoB_001712900 [Plakobranchus ocellatus]